MPAVLLRLLRLLRLRRYPWRVTSWRGLRGVIIRARLNYPSSFRLVVAGFLPRVGWDFFQARDDLRQDFQRERELLAEAKVKLEAGAGGWLSRWRPADQADLKEALCHFWDARTR